MFTQHFLYGLGGVSWSSVFAGTIMALALWMVLAVIGLALGFKVVDPKSDEPVSGLGKTMGIWYGVTNIVSMAGGAFITGLFAAYRGLEHGFLMWGLVTIVMVCYSSHAVSATIRSLLSAVRGVGSGAASMAGADTSMGKGVVHAASGAVDNLKTNLHLDLDMDKLSDKLNDNVISVLRDTGSESLQPEHLRQELREARAELKRLIRQLTLNPGNASQLISDFLEKEKNRLQNLTGEVDKETAITTLMNHRNIPRQEAETLVNNSIDAYEKAVAKAKASLTEINEQVEEAKEHFKDQAAQSRDNADKLSNSAAKGAAAFAGAMILAAIISMGFGHWGAKCAADWYKVPHSMKITSR